METKVKLNYLRIAPRKTRLAINLIRGKNVQKAMEQLILLKKSAAPAVLKLIKSGIASAKEKNMNVDDLIVSAVYCNEGPALKRRRINSRGSASQILKRTSHITLILKEARPHSTKSFAGHEREK